MSRSLSAWSLAVSLAFLTGCAAEESLLRPASEPIAMVDQHSVSVANLSAPTVLASVQESWRCPLCGKVFEKPPSAAELDAHDRSCVPQKKQTDDTFDRNLEARKQAYRRREANFNGKVQTYKSNSTVFENRVRTWSSKNSSLNDEIDRFNVWIKNVDNRVRGYNSRYGGRKLPEAEFDYANQLKSSLERELNETEAAKSNLQSRQQNLSNEKSNLERQQADLNSELRALQQEERNLQAELDAINDLIQKRN